MPPVLALSFRDEALGSEQVNVVRFSVIIELLNPGLEGQLGITTLRVAEEKFDLRQRRRSGLDFTLVHFFLFAETCTTSRSHY